MLALGHGSVLAFLQLLPFRLETPMKTPLEPLSQSASTAPFRLQFGAFSLQGGPPGGLFLGLVSSLTVEVFALLLESNTRCLDLLGKLHQALAFFLQMGRQLILLLRQGALLLLQAQLLLEQSRLLRGHRRGLNAESISLGINFSTNLRTGGFFR